MPSFPLLHLDVAARSRATITPRSIEIIRGATVEGLPISAGESDPSMLVKCLAISGFPNPMDPHPDPDFSLCLVDEIRFVGKSVSLQTVEADIVYRGGPKIAAIGGGIFFTLVQQTEVSFVDWYRLAGANGGNIQTWYVKGAGAGAPNAIPAKPAPVAPATSISMVSCKVHNPLCHEVLRATGLCSYAQWASVRTAIRFVEGSINSDTWGGYTRGKWLFLGANTRNIDSTGLSLSVELNFISNKPDWFAVEVHRNTDGRIPDDITPESVMRAGGLPALGQQIQGNGIVLASTIEEAAFTPRFSFTPQ